MITSYHDEAWRLMDHGTDRETGLPMCHVQRLINDGSNRYITWRLIKRTSRNGIVGWYNVGQFMTGCERFRRSPEKHGKKLSNSRTDLMLINFAEKGHSA